MENKPLINIAPLAEVTISSKSKWSTADDEREILLAEHDRRNFSFHTELEDSPYIILEFKKDYRISLIRILNRLNLCQERAKTLRIEYSKKKIESYNLLFDGNNCSWGILEIPTEGVSLNTLKFSLKGKNYFHLKKIEIFADLEFMIRDCTSDKARRILNICFCLYREFYESFVISLDSYNRIILYEKELDSRIVYFRYNIAFNEEKFLFCLEFFVNLETNPDFKLFITKQARQFHYNVKILDKKFSLIREIAGIDVDGVVEESRKSIEFIKKNTVVYAFLTILKTRKVVNINKYNNKNIIIIDSDLMLSTGFADRLRGILSLISICHEMNIDYYIKFDKPFELGKYYEFRELPSNFKTVGISRYVCKLSIPSPSYYLIQDFELKEIILYSLRYYNILTIGTNRIFSKTKYKELFLINFKKQPLLEKILSHYRNTINGEYVTISLRYKNTLGDFNETTLSKPLKKEHQVSLMRKCRYEIIKFMETIDKKYKVVVLSDSSTFLNYISDINNVYVFPENIMHIGKSTRNKMVNESGFIKTLVDFNILLESSHIIRFKTKYLYSTGFPRLASLCSGKPFSEHEF